jgi:hypothetical protein
VDNFSTHKHLQVKVWLGQNRRFHLQFTPTSNPWLNTDERGFRDLTDERIRRGSLKSVQAVTATIDDYISNHNQNPHIFA